MMTEQINPLKKASKMSILNLFFQMLTNAQPPQTRSLSSFMPIFTNFRIFQMLTECSNQNSQIYCPSTQPNWSVFNYFGHHIPQNFPLFLWTVKTVIWLKCVGLNFVRLIFTVQPNLQEFGRR